MKKPSKYFKIFTIITLIFGFTPIDAQKIAGIKFKSPKTLTEIPDSLKTEDAVIINKKTTINYIFDGHRFLKTNAIYYRMKLLTQKGVDEFSNFIVAKHPNQEIMVLDARTIKPNKNIVKLDKRDINTEDFKFDKYQNYQQLKVAIPGVSIGDEIEYAYSTQSSIYNVREELYFHDKIPALESNIVIIFNNKLEPLLLSFNGSPKPSSKTYDYETRYTFTMNNLDGIKNQNFSIKSNQLPFLAVSPKISDPQLRKLAGKGFAEQPVTNLREYISRVYTTTIERYKEQAQQAILDHHALQNQPNKFSKLKALHDYINKHLILRSLDESESKQPPAYYLKNNKSNYTNLVILYTQIFEALGIHYNFVLARNRYDGPIDQKMININQFEYPFFTYRNQNKKWSYLFPKDYSNFYELGELPLKFYGASAMTLPDNENSNPVYFTFGYSQRVSNFENRKIILEIDSENDSLLLDVVHAFGGAEYTKHKKEYIMALGSNTLESLFSKELIEWMNPENEEINWIGEMDQSKLSDISLDSISSTYMKLNYKASAMAGITQLDSNLFSLPLHQLISHYKQPTSDYKRILDYYPENEFVSKINFYVQFDKPVTLVNTADCETEFTTPNCHYKLKAAQINDSLIYIHSEYEIKTKYIAATDYEQLRELNSTYDNARNLNLVYMLNPN